MANLPVVRIEKNKQLPSFCLLLWSRSARTENGGQNPMNVIILRVFPSAWDVSGVQCERSPEGSRMDARRRESLYSCMNAVF